MEELDGKEIPDEMLEGIAGGNIFKPTDEQNLLEVAARAKRWGMEKAAFIAYINKDISWYSECLRILDAKWDSLS